MSDPDLFKIRAHVADFEALNAGYRVASDATRQRYRARLDLAYGDGPDERLDLFLPEGNGPLPIHIFVHGGYWRANVKEDYAFVAESVTAAGAIAAMVEYTLMPKVRMATLIGQVRQAAAWLADNATQFGGDPGAISASGHSAGAHLASYLAARGPHETAFPTAPVKALLLVSGIYDLRPITTSFLQPEIGLTPDEVADWSPFEARPRPAVPITLVVGHDETAPFHEQARDFGYAAGVRGAQVERVTMPGLNHMSIVRDMGMADSGMAELVAETIAASRL